MAATNTIQNQTAQTAWWRGAVIYQIYPRSFQDSNDDGIGDLAGIAQRLPYIASLGVDAIWISPFFPSPMKDFGYDVSEYCDVDPLFGTLKDFDHVITTAHALGIKVLIDLVLSHTSDQHDWFQKSKVDKNNSKADWYVWSDAKPDGSPPTNWLSIFGGSAWQWHGQRQQYYLHNFLVSQPDLNFHNTDVQDALLDVAQFWLTRGVDGFRLDTINFYFHDPKLRDNPPLPMHLRNSNIAPAVNPYNHQEHLYDKNRPENIAFLKRLRALLEKYNAAAVGEVGDAQRGLEILGEYTRGDSLMHMCYAFELLTNNRPSAQDIAQIMQQFDQHAADGWACWAYSNHDVVRQASRWQMPCAGLKLMTTLMMCLRGSVCIYQGEELGLTEANIAFEDLQDPYGIEFWPEFTGRDGCRTPMVWDSEQTNAGFSEHKPWLPINEQHQQYSVALSEQNPAALLHHYRKVIALRNEYTLLRAGDCSTVKAAGDVLFFYRTLGNQTLFCAFNLSANAASFDFAETGYTFIENDVVQKIDPINDKLTLPAWQAALALKVT